MGERVKPVSLLGPLTRAEERHVGDVLFVAGDRELARAPRRVAIVGSRRASPEGLRRAAKLSSLLALSGVVVVSGLAEGIDAAAHVACIGAGGRTIGVLGTPLERCYPAKHRALQAEVARDHLLVSPFEPDHTTVPADFVRRNRVMAVIAQASVVVEAGDASGTKHHALEQRRLGRPLFVLRSLVDRGQAAWPRAMVERGEAVVLDNVEQVLEQLSAAA